MNLSEHLTLAEVIRSDSAKRKGINNQPTEEHLKNLKLLAEKIFEPIRKHFGVPIYISSGYRSKELNSSIAGSSLTSQHCQGEALDIDMDGSANSITNADVFNFIKDHLEFDQLIWEFGFNINPDWVHVSYESTGKQRKQVLKSTKSGSKNVYTSYKG
jgi:hypothetical protein